MKISLSFIIFLVYCLTINAQISRDKINPDVTPQNETNPNKTIKTQEKEKATLRKKTDSNIPTPTPVPVPTPAPAPVPMPAPSPEPPQEQIKEIVVQPAPEKETQSPNTNAINAKKKLIEDGYSICQTHPDFGKIYCKKTRLNKITETTTYFYIDEDGIAMPIDGKMLFPESEDYKAKGKKFIESKIKSPKNDFTYVLVNRWVSPVVGDFVTLPASKATDEQLIAWGYNSKIFQYYGLNFTDKPTDLNIIAVNRWEMPNCKEFIIIAEHEITDATMVSWGYKNKQFLFYAYRNKPPEGNYEAISRWVNVLPEGNACKDFTLSIGEYDLTDAQLLSFGYTGKTVQFYVPKSR
jgi:hypothetical protein